MKIENLYYIISIIYMISQFFSQENNKNTYRYIHNNIFCLIAIICSFIILENIEINIIYWRWKIILKKKRGKFLSFFNLISYKTCFFTCFICNEISFVIFLVISLSMLLQCCKIPIQLSPLIGIYTIDSKELLI